MSVLLVKLIKNSFQKWLKIQLRKIQKMAANEFKTSKKRKKFVNFNQKMKKRKNKKSTLF